MASNRQSVTNPFNDAFTRWWVEDGQYKYVGMQLTKEMAAKIWHIARVTEVDPVSPQDWVLTPKADCPPGKAYGMKKDCLLQKGAFRNMAHCEKEYHRLSEQLTQCKTVLEEIMHCFDEPSETSYDYIARIKQRDAARQAVRDMLDQIRL